ncbi:MAG: imidazole glycerol phosphate synthase subunit HisH [Sphingobacteriales bacterium]|nr:MAG: imidazole glycerol phosphate synthase subunit HisH [Sphingobacteriales bacterium]
MNIAIIRYNAGNVQSVQYALKRLGFSAIVTDDENALKSADKIIFPGVGNAGAAMQSLKDKDLHEIIPTLTQPVLGICVGMQLLCNYSEEADTQCLGIIDTTVKKFAANERFKVPQMGWNSLQNYRSALLTGLEENSFVYYVHSYYAALCADTVATTDYTLRYSAIVQKNNFYGVQFHTEKSAATGDRILLNFLNL